MGRCAGAGRAGAARRAGFAAVAIAATWALGAPQPITDPAVTPLSPGSQPDAPELAAPPITPEMAQAAWDAQRWREAANAYRVLAREHPDDGEFAFRLAYSLHASGQYRRAIRAHQAAAEFEQYRATSLYNLGCAHAVLGENDQAFDALGEAFDAGFDDRALLEQDQDLLSLHDDPRWRELVAGHRPGGPAPGGPVERQVSFLLGEWEVLDDRGRRIGAMSTRLEHDGHAVVREYRGDNGESGTALLFYDAVADAWRQVSIDSRGVVLDLTGDIHRAELELEGELHGPRGERFLRRTVTAQDRRGDLEIRTSESEDAGRTWREVGIVTHRRFGIVPPGRGPEPYRVPPNAPGRGEKPAVGGPSLGGKGHPAGV